MSIDVSFTIPGKPATAGSKRAFIVNKGKPNARAIVTDDCKRGEDWRATVQLAAKAHFQAPIAGPVIVHVIFELQRPDSHYGTGKNAGKLKASAPLAATAGPTATKAGGRYYRHVVSVDI